MTVQFLIKNTLIGHVVPLDISKQLPLAIWVHWPPVKNIDYPCTCKIIYEVVKDQLICGYPATTWHQNPHVCNCVGEIIE